MFDCPVDRDIYYISSSLVNCFSVVYAEDSVSLFIDEISLGPLLTPHESQLYQDFFDVPAFSLLQK